MKEIIIKSGGQVKDVDIKGRTVTGYFSTWGYGPAGEPVPDSDGEIIELGAFSKTLSQNGPTGANRIWHLFNHNASMPIGKPSVLIEDNKGLYFETTFPDTALANDTLKLYEAGAITEHSIGFNVIQSRNENDYKLLQEVRLWEGSSVLWGANADTPFLGVKSEQLAVLDALMRNGTMTDETFIMLEKLLNDYKQQRGEPAQEPQPEPDKIDLVKKFYSQIKI